MEETANQERSDTQTAGLVTEQMVIMENNVHESREDREEVAHNLEFMGCNPAEETVRKEEEIAAGENEGKGAVSLELYGSLPKVVADCVEAVLAAASESTDGAAVNTSEPGAGEVITEDSSEGAGDTSADVALIETTEPECDAVTPETGKPNGAPSPDAEPVSLMMETIPVFVHVKPSPTPADLDRPAEQHPAPGATEILSKEGSVLKEITRFKQEKPPADEEASETCESFLVDEYVIVESPSNEPITTKELCISGKIQLGSVGEDGLLEFDADDDPAAGTSSPVEEEINAAPLFVPVSGEQEASVTFSKEPVIHETDSSDFFSAVEDNTEDSQISSSNEPVVKRVEAVGKATAEEAERNLVASEEERPGVIAEVTDKRTDLGAESHSAAMEALLVRLRSGCTSIVEESAYRLGGLEISALGGSVIIAFHVAQKAELQ